MSDFPLNRTDLTNMDFARFDKQSVHAGLRNRDDGRAARYNRFVEMLGLDRGEVTPQEASKVFSAHLYAGTLNSLEQACAVRMTSETTPKRSSALFETLKTAAFFIVCGVGVVWWLSV